MRFHYLAAALLAAIAPAALIAAPAKLPAGDTFEVAQGWTATAKGQVILLTPPEADNLVAVVEVGAAANATEAVAKAWALAQPTMTMVPKLVSERPGRNGWDARAIADYEIPPNAKRAIQAQALHAGNRWTVLLISMDEGIAEKRAAAINGVAQSLRPAGYTRESFAGRTPRALDAPRIEAMKSFVSESMQKIGVPGVGLALISDNKVVWSGGLGIKELGKSDPVDGDTLFMIASNTKGMATLLLSTLVDDGKIKWDQPVTEVYPSFRLGDDATTKSVLVKHLVCACTGLPRKDLEWIFATSATTPASDTFRQLAATQPTSKFGEVFQYNNLMASAAGYIGGHLVYPQMELGAAFDRAMQERIFGPLGMTRTTFSMKTALAGNHASPHGWGVGTTPLLGSQDFNYMVYPARPAGGAWSSANDMAKYVQLELTKGVLPSGKRLVSESALLARRARGVPEGENRWYGMGLSEDATWDVPVIHHGGSMAGYKSDWLAIPSAGIGLVLLTNAEEGQGLLRPTMRRLLELVYDGKPEADGDVTAYVKRFKEQNDGDRPKLTIPPDPAAVKALAKRYTSPELGTLTVEQKGGETLFRFTSWSTTVASKREGDGSLSFVSTDPLNAWSPMVVGNRDGKRVLIVRDAQHEYVYTEVAS